MEAEAAVVLGSVALGMASTEEEAVPQLEEGGLTQEGVEEALLVLLRKARGEVPAPRKMVGEAAVPEELRWTPSEAAETVLRARCLQQKRRTASETSATQAVSSLWGEEASSQAAVSTAPCSVTVC